MTVPLLSRTGFCAGLELVIPAKAGIQSNRLKYVTFGLGPSLRWGDESLRLYYWQL